MVEGGSKGRCRPGIVQVRRSGSEKMSEKRGRREFEARRNHYRCRGVTSQNPNNTNPWEGVQGWFGFGEAAGSFSKGES